MDLKGANLIMYPCFLIFGGGMILLSLVESSSGFINSWDPNRPWFR